MTYGHTCASCNEEFTRGNSWNGRGETKYCHRRPCIRLGVERGDIVPRSMSKGASSRRPSPDGAEFFEGKNELLKLKEIVSARHFAAGRLRGEVAASNKIPSEERMLYLLVYGKFMRDVDDEEGGAGVLLDDSRAALLAGEDLRRGHQAGARRLPRARRRAVGA